MEGLAKLGFDWPVLIAQLVNFVVLFALLYLVAYKPLMRMLDERAGRIKQNMDEAESTRKKAEETNNDAQRRLENAGKQGQDLISQAAKNAEDIRQKAELEARREAQAIIQRAQNDIQRQKDEAVDEIRREFADLTILAAEKVIESSLDKEKHVELIEKTLEESSAAGETD